MQENPTTISMVAASIGEGLATKPQRAGSQAPPKQPVTDVGRLAYFEHAEANIFGAAQEDPAADNPGAVPEGDV